MFVRNILLAVGVLALVAGVFLAGLWLSQGPGTNAASNAPASTDATRANPGSGIPANYKQVLTAAHPIAAGTLLRPDDVAWKPVPPSDIVAGAIVRDKTTETAYLGAIARRAFTAGEAFSVTALLKPTDRGFLSATLSPGSRAISIAVEASQSASGLLLPDDHVDIILTQSFDQEADPTKKFVGETLLQNLRVIAMDRRLSPYDETAKNASTSPESEIPKTITLEVTPRQAEMLMMASRLGKVDVAVRSLERSDVEEHLAIPASAPVWASDVSPALNQLRSAPVRPAGPAAPAAAPAPRARTPIEVMHGSKIEAR